MYTGAKEVKPLSDFRLLILFDNGERRIFDVSPYLKHGIYRDLQNPRIFNTARVDFDSVIWPNGADFAPEVLYRESIPADAF